MFTRRLAAFALAPLIFVAGCGDDSTDPDDTFTDSEASLIADAIGDVVDLFASDLGGPGASAAQSVVAAAPSTTQLSRSRACPTSGNASITGTRTTDTNALDETVTFALTSCVARNATLDGGVTLTLSVRTPSATQTNSTLTATGQVEVQLASGRNRSCTFDFTETNTTTSGTTNTTRTGKICGRLATNVLTD